MDHASDLHSTIATVIAIAYPGSDSALASRCAEIGFSLEQMAELIRKHLPEDDLVSVLSRHSDPLQALEAAHHEAEEIYYATRPEPVIRGEAWDEDEIYQDAIAWQEEHGIATFKTKM